MTEADQNFAKLASSVYVERIIVNLERDEYSKRDLPVRIGRRTRDQKSPGGSFPSRVNSPCSVWGLIAVDRNRTEPSHIRKCAPPI